MKDDIATVLVIDGQGGGIGKSIISELRLLGVKAEIVGAGTNPYASEILRKAGASLSVCGEERILSAIKRADIIAGPIGIIISNSLKGEVSPSIAYAVADSNVPKVLVPLNKCNIVVVGVQDRAMSDNIAEVARTINNLLLTK